MDPNGRLRKRRIDNEIDKANSALRNALGGRRALPPSQTPTVGYTDTKAAVRVATSERIRAKDNCKTKSTTQSTKDRKRHPKSQKQAERNPKITKLASSIAQRSPAELVNLRFLVDGRVNNWQSQQSRVARVPSPQPSIKEEYSPNSGWAEQSQFNESCSGQTASTCPAVFRRFVNEGSISHARSSSGTVKHTKKANLKSNSRIPNTKSVSQSRDYDPPQGLETQVNNEVNSPAPDRERLGLRECEGTEGEASTNEGIDAEQDASAAALPTLAEDDSSDDGAIIEVVDTRKQHDEAREPDTSAERAIEIVSQP